MASETRKRQLTWGYAVAENGMATCGADREDNVVGPEKLPPNKQKNGVGFFFTLFHKCLHSTSA
jgi:hypothetical protein